ncbi:MAG: ABC transporter substrate-binding protein [Bacteriovorax sp.]
MSNYFPSRIVCMTEESVEFFYAINRSDVIAGVSVYAVRPAEVKKLHPVISSFTHANIKKILEQKPELVLGFSDIQKDIARELINEGVDVFISNQRSLEDILRYLSVIGNMIGEGEKTKGFISKLESKIEWARKEALKFKKRPRVYIEEWDEPRICGIRWFSELVELCGGIDIFKEKSLVGVKASDRLVADEEVVALSPDIILACWCGKKVDKESFGNRVKYSDIPAVKNKYVIELPPEIFLQPGPALILEGIDQLLSLFSEFQSN